MCGTCTIIIMFSIVGKTQSGFRDEEHPVFGKLFLL